MPPLHALPLLPVSDNHIPHRMVPQTITTPATAPRRTYPRAPRHVPCAHAPHTPQNTLERPPHTLFGIKTGAFQVKHAVTKPLVRILYIRCSGFQMGSFYHLKRPKSARTCGERPFSYLERTSKNTKM